MTFLNVIILPNNKELKIYQSDLLFKSNAVSLMLRMYSDLIDNKLALGNIIPFTDTNSIIWAEVDDIPVAGICYNKKPEHSYVWVIFSFTHPEWRKLGINKACYDCLETEMRKENLRHIGSYVHVNNTERLESHKKIGMRPTFYRMSKTIKD